MKKALKSTLAPLALAALALGMTAPAMAATDGQLGTTSTGDFTLAIQVNAPPPSQVEIIGLDDVIFTVTTNNSSDSVSSSASFNYFCINRSDAGDVTLRFDQFGGNLDTSPVLQGPGSGPASTIEADFTVFDAVGNQYIVNLGTPFPIARSNLNEPCTAASGAGVANRYRFAVPPLPPHSVVAYEGLYSATMVVTLSPS